MSPQKWLVAAVTIALSLVVASGARAQQRLQGGVNQDEFATGDQFVVCCATQVSNDSFDIKLKNLRTHYVHSRTVLIGFLGDLRIGDIVRESGRTGVLQRVGSGNGGQRIADVYATRARPEPIPATPDGPSPGPAQTPDPTQRRPLLNCSVARNRYFIRDAADLAGLVFHGYSRRGGAEPIGIYLIGDRGSNTYLVTLSGTDLGKPGQATWLPQDVHAAMNLNDAYREAVLSALSAARVPRGAILFFGSHSLGAMEAQNLVTDSRFRASYRAAEVITYGSPKTADEVPGVHYVRFAAMGDPIVNMTMPARLWDSARSQIWLNNQVRLGQGRAPFSGVHLSYPKLNDLRNYRIGTGGAGWDLIEITTCPAPVLPAWRSSPSSP